jgi:lipid-binding SYLF domain-containing protein
VNRTTRPAACALACVFLVGATASVAATKSQIDAGAAAALRQFEQLSPDHRKLDETAEALLIFPRVTKGGAGVAGGYGEGVLLINGKPAGYFSLKSASLGLTLGIEKHREIILFMTPQALNRFTSTYGWSVGADGGVAMLSKGAGFERDTKTRSEPVLGFIFSEKGLIGDLSLEGSKVDRIER